jgi:hypothetical protein
MDIVAFVAQRLGIEQSQAKGAIGLLLNLAKSKLGEERFSQLAQYVPGAEQLIAAAPQSGGLAGALGGMASALGGEKAGKLADLAGGLSKVGLKADDLGGLVSAVTAYCQENGKTEAASMLQDVLQ